MMLLNIKYIHSNMKSRKENWNIMMEWGKKKES